VPNFELLCQILRPYNAAHNSDLYHNFASDEYHRKQVTTQKVGFGFKLKAETTKAKLSFWAGNVENLFQGTFRALLKRNKTNTRPMAPTI